MRASQNPAGFEFDVSEYLQRIRVEEIEEAKLAFLRKLHRQHLYHIPFENLDIHWKREILLDIPRLYQKIIRGRRGGFCYELNGIFSALLNKLGYTAYPVSAKMVQADGSLSPDFEHMAVLVELEGHTWLADVGFGKGFLSPIKVVDGHVQMDFNRFYKVVSSGGEWWLQESTDGTNFTSRYLFSPKRRNLFEFINRCDYQQHDPFSHFQKQKLITIATPDGRITLTDRRLVVLRRGELTEYVLLNEDEFLFKLEEYFSVSRPTDLA